MRSGKIEQLCYSCGKGWVLDLSQVAEEVNNCTDCRQLCRQIERELCFRPKSSAAKKLYFEAIAAKEQGKFVLAWDLLQQCISQGQQDRDEATARKERNNLKKQRWHARQPDRRQRDHAETMSRRGK